jgi:hypothetical protein
MGFSLNGYLLEKPRVGAANSPFTSSPDDLVSDPVAFAAAFPSNDELVPGRTEYLVVAIQDGNLPVAQFGWTKNETGNQRFDYDGTVGNFRPLPGGARTVVGVLGPDSNTNRLKILIPVGSAPYRIALGDIGSGITFSISTVPNDTSFGTPASGSVEVSLSTGNLNWNTGDLTTYEGQTVLFQQQAPFTLKESTGQIGVVGANPILLNPIPESSQYPLLKFGFGGYLNPIAVTNEASFTNPPSGSFEWAQDTGLIRFNSTDQTTYSGFPVYYDGILFEVRALSSWSSGSTIGSGTLYVNPIPRAGEDLAILAMSGSTIVHQFPNFVLVPDNSHFVADKAGQIQITADTGQIRFYPFDFIRYFNNTLRIVFGDFLIENGVSLRLFRSPVNLDGSNPNVKDVTAFYSITNATLASPIVGAPMVFLPVLPVDDISHPMTFLVEQGTGTFIGPLPRLDVSSPPTGVGYTLDFDQKQFFFATRVNSHVTPILYSTGALTLDPFIDPSNASFTLNGVPQVIGEDVLLDSNAGVVSFITQYGTVVAIGTRGYASSSFVFRDASANFTSLVLPGDLLVIAAGVHKGVYNVVSVASNTSLNIDSPITGSPTNLAYQIRRGSEILADRYFQLVQFIDPHVVVQLVRNSITTTLVQGKDYIVSGGLGTFQTTFRLLSGDQINLTYPSSQDNPDPTVLNPILTYERGTFLHRKELTVHNSPTSVIPFNPAGLTVASNPAPVVYRGGRPQDSSQVRIDTTHSTITFLPDVLPTPSGFNAVDDTLPHGPVVNPNENVYIDYNTYEALGGENTVVILKPDLILTPVQINSGASFFTVRGDRTAEFPANYLIRIETEAVYYLAAPSYDSTTDTTTVNLLSPQVFSDSATNPKIYISSGPVNIPPTQPVYFVLESSTFNDISRGMNQVVFPGEDLSGTYVTGKVMYLTGGTANEFYLVSGSSYDATSNATTVTLTVPTVREYRYATSTLYRSVRPIYESTTVNLHTSGTPAVPITNPPTTLLDTVLLYRKIPGQVGQILSSPADFKIDETGKVILVVPLQPNEAISILYTKYRIVQPGTLLSSYTHTIVPTKENGLLNQVLTYSAYTYVPDSFYVRVETMTNFRGQMATAFQAEASASVPSSGPRVSNTSQPKLFEQGNKSAFFDEGEYANEDIVARATLKFYNDTINFLEDVLQQMDGRVVGDWDGRFKFDGTTGHVAPSISAANNQIDDIISLAFLNVIRAYQSGTQSRFYPTSSSVSQVILQGVNTGDPIMDFGVKPITGSSPTFFKRFQRALITKSAKAGDLVLYVDNTAAITSPPLRPAFETGLLVAIADPTTVYVPDTSPLTVTSVAPTSLGVSALPVNIPAGSTVYLSTQDVIYPPKSYRVGIDVTLDTTNGYLLYAVPIPVIGQAPVGGDMLQGTVFFGNTSTSPKKFPALYGQTLDDSGDQRYPLLNPSLNCESNSLGADYLTTELSYVQSGGLLTPPNIADPLIGTGSLDITNTTLSLDSSTFPSPVPQPGDLVRILTGTVPSIDPNFHVIRYVFTNHVVVETPFAANDSHFSFEITTSNNLVSGSTESTTGTTLTDLTATFITSGVKPGYTVVATQAGVTYQRRQVVSVDSETQLTLNVGFSPALSGNSYRICNPLNTFSDLGTLQNAVYGLWNIVNNFEVPRLQSYFDSVFTDRLSPATASGTVFGNTITDNSVDFVASGVIVGDYVYAPVSQASEGIFQVTQVIDSHNLLVDGSPVAGAISFRVVHVFGASKQALQGIFTILQQCVTFGSPLAAWYYEFSTAITVVPDSLATAQGLDPTSVSTRASLDIARQTQVTNAISFIQSTLADTDKLYDSRYAWIDERINFQTGVLVQQQRAVANRIKAQQDALSAMIKILAVQ